MSDPTPHVLLVVDAEEDRRSLHDILAGEGYRLTDAKGADALEVARDLEPCVTLVDGAGAAEVLAKLKSDPGTRDLAVIVLSAAEDAAGLLGRREAVILEVCRSPEFTVEKLKQAIGAADEIH